MGERQLYKGLEIKAHPLLHKEVMDIIADLKLNKDVSILILASGSGAFDQRLIDHGYLNLTSVEINEEGYKNDKQTITFLRRDLNEKFSQEIEGKYDLIIAMEIIEHVYSPNNFIAESKKLLKDSSSILLISTPNLHSVFSRVNNVLFGYPNYFIVKPGLYDHVSPIYINVFEHLCELNQLKIDKIFFRNSFFRHFEFCSIRSIVYLLLILLLVPIVFIFSLFNRKNLYGNSVIFLLKNL